MKPQVRKGDGASAFLCGDCAQILFMAYKFKKTAVEKEQSRWQNFVWANGVSFSGEVPPKVPVTLYNCYYCDKNFRSKSSRNAHQKSHNG